jgi:hypothetical protein
MGDPFGARGLPWADLKEAEAIYVLRKRVAGLEGAAAARRAAGPAVWVDPHPERMHDSYKDTIGKEHLFGPRASLEEQRLTKNRAFAVLADPPPGPICPQGELRTSADLG